MIKELDIVVLTKNLTRHGLKKGDVGTVVLSHPKGGYEVEFVTLGGDTIGVVTLKPDDIRLTGKREIPHVRAVA